MDARESSVGGERAVLALAALLLLLPALGSVGLSAPDEPRAAEVTRELFGFEHGPSGLLLLRLNGEPYTQKPPLYYWMAAACSLVPGDVTEWSARLPSALGGLATLWLTVILGARLVGRRSALLGAALLLTTYKFAWLSRRVQFDVVLAAFELGALLAFWRLDRAEGSASRNRLAMHACMGMAMLTKGPVGFLVPMLVVASFLALDGRVRELRRTVSPAGLALSFGPILAWLGVAVALAPAGFFGEAVGGGVLSRFFEGTSHARPFYYFVYQFPLEFLPWALLWPAVVWAGWRRVFVEGAEEGRRRAWRFLAAWVGATLVFFSLSAGKRGLYLLPCFPAVALLCADSIRTVLAGRVRPPRAVSVGAAAGAAALVGVALYFARRGEVAGATLPTSFLALMAGAPVLGAVAWIAFVRAGRAAVVVPIAVACVWTIEAAAFTILNPALDSVRSVAPIARAALRWLGPDEPVALLGSRPMIGGLSYYARRPVHWLEEAREVPGYFASGGRAVVMDADKLPDVQRRVDVTVLARLREGERAVLVVGPVNARRTVPQTPPVDETGP
jgi:4-amino-4-deoxy-L-arabinose transferase-like glycosyltransferase